MTTVKHNIRVVGAVKLVEAPKELEWWLEVRVGSLDLMCREVGDGGGGWVVVVITESGELVKPYSNPDNIGLQVLSDGRIRERVS